MVPVRIGKTHLWSEVGSKNRGICIKSTVFSRALNVRGSRFPSTMTSWEFFMSCVCSRTVCGVTSDMTRTSATASASVPEESCMAVYVAVTAETGGCEGTEEVEIEVVLD